MSIKADLIVLGNIITMDEKKPHAEAVAVRDGKIFYVGDGSVAKKLSDSHTEIFDYGSNSVYPGFLEAHCHTGGAGYRMTGLAYLDIDASLEECVQAMKEYMAVYPDREQYNGMGFSIHGVYPTASMLDAICPDKPMCCTDFGGHAMWINTKAMEKYGINKEAVAEFGTDCVNVDENGDPTGYITETAVFFLRSQVKMTVDEFKTAIIGWEDYALSMGYTGAYNAGLEISSAVEPEAYFELDQENKLRLYTFAGSFVQDNTDTPEEEMERIARLAKEHNSDHFKVIGAKVFCDGTIELRTAWMLEDYADEPGYKGVKRFNDHDKMVRLVKAAAEHNMNVHIHAIGNAASKAWVDAIAEAEEATGNFDMRNAIAHLVTVEPDTIRRFGVYNIIPVCAMMWVEKTYNDYEVIVKFFNEKLADEGYPVKSFQDNGAVVVSHSDYPVSPAFSVPHSICYGNIRYLPSHGKEMQRKNTNECLSREDTLKALTINVAYSWHAEDRMGSLEIGKLANFTVFDKDFLKDTFEEIENAKCLATFVDGKQVYRN
ncbi:MAG: amidohydrolase [Lachnospiraceae bacterium]|nr:amidohydrolase [Lachnospiraceae bacterium]